MGPRIRLGLLLPAAVTIACLGCAGTATAGTGGERAAASAGKQKMLRVVILGLPGRGNALAAAQKIAYPGARYRKFLTQAEFRQQFGAGPKVRQKVLTLRNKAGVRQVSLNPSQTVALTVMTPAAAKRLFCAGPKIPGKPCRPKGYKWAIKQVSVGEIFPKGPPPTPPRSAVRFTGTPEGCSGAIKSKALTPNQLNTAYEVDELHSRGLDGSGVRVNTLSSAVVGTSDFKTWANCFNQPQPRVTQFAMPGGVNATRDDPDETVLDVEALAAIAPRLEQITPIFVPLDQNFSNSFILFMLGSLDPSRQGGKLPDILSISDGVCEYRFTKAEKYLSNRLLAEAAALGITSLSASGDLGFQGCESSKPGTSFPASSRFVTAVGGTNLTLSQSNQITAQPVWSTYATEPKQGVGSGGGPSHFWPRPPFQTGPGITPSLQKGSPMRLTPDVGAMASFKPGIAVYQEGTGGWGGGGGTSAATPLTAAMVALAVQQEKEAGRPPLGSINPLLYSLARGPGYGSIFYDVTVGTASRKPKTPFGKSPAGGAAQPGYDLATGLGSLRATAFADAVAATPPAP
jgi:subtilase family serine protease